MKYKIIHIYLIIGIFLLFNHLVRFEETLYDYNDDCYKINDVNFFVSYGGSEVDVCVLIIKKSDLKEAKRLLSLDDEISGMRLWELSMEPDLGCIMQGDFAIGNFDLDDNIEVITYSLSKPNYSIIEVTNNNEISRENSIFTKTAIILLLFGYYPSIIIIIILFLYQFISFIYRKRAVR